MVVDAERAARNAEQDYSNEPGYCLQQTRIWCDIDSKDNDAATAWRNTNNRHPGDRSEIPRGAAVYWTGGSKGFGHIALSLGKGKVRSTDAAGSGKVATRDLGWFDAHWPSLTYAGWAWDINEVTIPHEKPGDEVPYTEWPSKDRSALANDVATAILAADLYGQDPELKVTVGRALRVMEKAGTHG